MFIATHFLIIFKSVSCTATASDLFAWLYCFPPSADAKTMVTGGTEGGALSLDGVRRGERRAPGGVHNREIKIVQTGFDQQSGWEHF